MNMLGIAVPAERPVAGIPPKIQAALAFTHFCEHVQHQIHQTVSGVEKGGRKLSSGEQRCYDAAISCMTEYFNDEGFGDAPPPNPPGNGNAPTPLVPKPVQT